MKQPPKIYVRVGRNLRAGADANGLTQVEVARKTGLHSVTVNRIFQGKQLAPLDTIEALCRACGVPIEKIFAKPS